MYIWQYYNINFQKIFLEVNILYAVFLLLNTHQLTSGHVISIQSALTLSFFQSGSASG